MSEKKYQVRTRLLHEFQLHHKASDAKINIDAALGEGTVSISTAKRWFAKFKSGDLSLEDKERPGRPQEIDRDAVLAAIEEDPTQTTRMLAIEFQCAHKQIVRILHELGKRNIKSRWVPHELNENQKKARVNAAEHLLARQKSQPFLDLIVTCDEKWVFFNNPVRSSGGSLPDSLLLSLQCQTGVNPRPCSVCGGAVPVSSIGSFSKRGKQ